MRRAGKRDANHAAVRQVLRDIGCSVLDLGNVGAGCPDLLVATPRGDRTFLLEVKDGDKPPSARKLTAQQRDFAASWKGETHVVTSRQEAMVVALRGQR